MAATCSQRVCPAIGSHRQPPHKAPVAFAPVWASCTAAGGTTDGGGRRRLLESRACMAWPRHGLRLLLLSAVLCAASAARSVRPVVPPSPLDVVTRPARPQHATGVLVFGPAASTATSSSTSLGTPETTPGLAADCAASAVADLQDRLALPQWDPAWVADSFEAQRQGPVPLTLPPINASHVPPRCQHHGLAWARMRLLAAVDATIQLGLNYCHFKLPGYEAPLAVRRVCMRPDGSVAATGSASEAPTGCTWVKTSICSEEGLRRAAHPWQGLDCSNFVAWALNIAFGYSPTTHVAEQCGHPTRAPGRLLHTITSARLEALAPGDLVFGAHSRHGAARSAVRHVALWTGHEVDFSNASSRFFNATLLANVPPGQRATVVACLAQQLALGRPVWVVADSGFAGPAYRPFCGAYLRNFSHARRILHAPGDAAAWPFKNHAAVAVFNESTRQCVSSWRLAAGAGGRPVTHARPHRVVDESMF